MTLPDFTQASNFGLISSLQTDNIIFNVIVAMIIPALIGALTAYSNSVSQHFITLWKKWTHCDHYYRTIRYEENVNQYGETYAEGKDNTNILQKAISLYLNENWPSTYKEGEYKFIDPNEDCDDDSEDEDDVAYQNNSLLRQLRDNRVITQPERDHWVRINKQLEYQRTRTEKEQGDNNEKETKRVKSVTTAIEFRAQKKENVDNFISEALVWYKQYIIQKNKKQRYMYMLQGATEGSRRHDMNFKRYNLGSNKTFRTIFIPNKAQVLQMIDNFQAGTGKFAIEGFPKQLSIMLTGPPGTGKTSLIKAISEYTNRHIVDIPIAKIDTNQALYDIMFGRSYYRESEGYADKHSFSRTIFVIEDIDCVSDIVYKRKENEENEDNKEESDKDKEKDDSIMKELLKMGSKNTFKYGLQKDPLTLSGILNVIDGVIDCPRRIIIITTNHPEKLDPALIRPGRINIKLHLGFVHVEEALGMISHYVRNIETDEEKQIRQIFETAKNNVTPATIEKLCIEYDTVPEIVVALREEFTKTNLIEP